METISGRKTIQEIAHPLGLRMAYRLLRREGWTVNPKKGSSSQDLRG